MKRSWHDIKIMVITGIIAILTLLSGCLLDSSNYLFFLLVLILGVMYLGAFYMANCDRWKNYDIFNFIKLHKNTDLTDIYVKNVHTGETHKVGSDPNDSLWVDRFGVVHYKNYQNENGYYEFIPSYCVLKEVIK